MSRTRLLTTCFAMCLATAACHRGPAPAVETQANAGASTDAVPPDDSCPAAVPATTVTVVNTKSGVAMFFTTTPSNVEEVRRRVTAASKVDTTVPRPEPEESETEPLPEWVFGEAPQLVPLQAKVEEVSDGAALVLTPLDVADIEEIRTYAYNYANKMKLGRCPADFMKMPQAPGAQNAVLPPADKIS